MPSGCCQNEMECMGNVVHHAVLLLPLLCSWHIQNMYKTASPSMLRGCEGGTCVLFMGDLFRSVCLELDIVVCRWLCQVRLSFICCFVLN